MLGSSGFFALCAQRHDKQYHVELGWSIYSRDEVSIEWGSVAIFYFVQSHTQTIVYFRVFNSTAGTIALYLGQTNHGLATMKEMTLLRWYGQLHSKYV